MRTGELIRTLRKEKKLTQEQVADLLGVSAPAVNKWENGNSMPDVMLLAPLARLLGTDVNTLLNFQEELSEKEIGRIANEISMKLIKENYEVEHTLDFATIIEDLGILCRKNGGLL